MIHILVVCLTICLLPLVAACSNQDDSQPEGGNASLLLNIATIGQTLEGQTLADNERMHSVRVVVLNAEGAVEHNRFYSLGGAQDERSILLKVTPGEKEIFLFANEESVSLVEGVTSGTSSPSLTAFFSNYQTGSPGFEDQVNALYFKPDYTGGKPIPMSSMYTIEVSDKEVAEKTFYVVRVATKFTMNFINWRGQEVTVNSFSIEKYADKNFLMAHVKDTPLFNGKTWIEWLKEVSDASSENDDYATTEAAGWLKDYELPKQANKEQTYTYPSEVTVGAAHVNIDYPGNSTPGKAATTPIFYLPESMNPKAGATDGEQEYILKLNIADGNQTKTFSRKLPNLKALFRNTHVVVNITMLNSMEIVVDVIPYSEKYLDPDFGLNVE